MAQYLITAKNPAGRQVTELVTADSAKAAVQDMQDRGHEGIVLHTEDAGAQVIRPIEITPMMTARDLVQNRTRGSFQRTAVVTLRSYAMMWKFSALTIALVVLRRALYAPWGIFDSILVAAALLPAVLAVASRYPAIRYHRMLEAESWRRSHQVLRMLPRVAPSLTPPIAAWYQAKALAGLGRLDEALEVFMPFAHGEEIPKARFWTLLATIYRVGQKDDLSIAAYEQALEFAPDDPAILIGLANNLLDKRGDVRRAKELLERARQQPRSDLSEPFMAMAEGMIALEEGNPRLAVEKLQPAWRRQRQYGKGIPTCAAAADLLEARLALAKALAGELDAAGKHFRRAEPRLLALKADKLLARCRQALGSFLEQ